MFGMLWVLWKIIQIVFWLIFVDRLFKVESFDGQNADIDWQIAKPRNEPLAHKYKLWAKIVEKL